MIFPSGLRRLLSCSDKRGEEKSMRSALRRAAQCSLGVLCAAATSVALAVVPATPTVDGPITGPEPMHPGIRIGPEGTNPTDFDYVVDEYFVSGTAGPAGAT